VCLVKTIAIAVPLHPMKESPLLVSRNTIKLYEFISSHICFVGYGTFYLLVYATASTIKLYEFISSHICFSENLLSQFSVSEAWESH
jgi:hypothetical protein